MPEAQVAHPKLLQAVEKAQDQQIALIIDIDDTYVRGCVEQHMKYARWFAQRSGYSGPHPTLQEALALGSVQAFYEPHCPQIADWAEHLRSSQKFHATLPPIRPNFPEIFSRLSEVGFSPSLGLTARPENLTNLSESIIQETSGEFVPVRAAEVNLPINKTAVWKLENLLHLDRLLGMSKPIILLDDSSKTIQRISELGHPRIQALHYSEDPRGAQQANWDTLIPALKHFLPTLHR